MIARRIGAGVSLLLAITVASAWAVDQLDYLDKQAGTSPVALTGGDTPNTYQVYCTSNTLAAGATLLIAAVNAGNSPTSIGTQNTGRPLRNRCFQNVSNIKVYIGSSTVAASDFWTLGESTSTSLYSNYCTHNSGALYCAPFGISIATMNIIQEIQSQP